MIDYTTSLQFEPDAPFNSDNFVYQVIPMSSDIFKQIQYCYLMVYSDCGLGCSHHGRQRPLPSGAYCINVSALDLCKLSVIFYDKDENELLETKLDVNVEDAQYLVLMPFEQELTLSQLKNPKWNLVSDRVYPEMTGIPSYNSSKPVWVTIKSPERNYVTSATYCYNALNGFSWDANSDSWYIPDDHEVIAWCYEIDTDPLPYKE